MEKLEPYHYQNKIQTIYEYFKTEFTGSGCGRPFFVKKSDYTQIGDEADWTLKKLNITETRGRGCVLYFPKDIFTGLYSLEELNLSDNDLGDRSHHPDVLPESVFSDLENLKILNLRKNDLLELPGNLFGNLHKLVELDLLANQLKELPKDLFHGLVNLQVLYLGSNSIQDLDIDIFKDLKSLEILSLASNEIKWIDPDVFKYLKKLKLLRIHGNPLDNENLRRDDEVFSKLPEDTKIISNNFANRSID